MSGQTRKFLHALLALIMLAQSMALLAAPHPGSPGASIMASSQPADEPCMRTMGQYGNEQLPSCCNDNCPDLASCALAQLTTLPSPTVLALIPRIRIYTSLPDAHLVVLAPDTLFRPPIPLHA